MQIRNRTAAVAAALGATLLTSAATAPLTATASTPAGAVIVTVTPKAITFQHGTTISAGRVVFGVRAPSGHHTLQLLRLHPGYPMQTAGRDIGKAFQGDVKAIRRVDTRIDWLGGAAASPGNPGHFAVRLAPGDYVALDQDGNALQKFHVVDAPAGYPAEYPSSLITTKHNQFHTHTSLALPHASWLKYHNNATEPHFLSIQRVKQSTTKKEVRDFAAAGGHGTPPWALKAGTDLGVVSPGTSVLLQYHLPAGKYVLSCFWPSIDTGMPHFTMGMFKLVELS